MTTRDTTGLLAQRDAVARSFLSRVRVIGWGAIQWPWLARSLWGGRRADKRVLLDHLGLAHDALPNLGSWKADVAFLRHIVGAVEKLRPREVVELGCGASTLVLAQALSRKGGGRLTSFDQHAGFTAATGEWLADHGLHASMRHAPLVADPSRWSESWYDLSGVPDSIDLLVIDGPPWAVDPFIRGRAEVLFERIAPGGMVLLDDAARPGERVVAREWRKRWPGFEFVLDTRGAKGTLIGTRAKHS